MAKHLSKIVIILKFKYNSYDKNNQTSSKNIQGHEKNCLGFIYMSFCLYTKQLKKEIFYIIIYWLGKIYHSIVFKCTMELFFF